MKFDDRCFDCLLSRVSLECSLCNADKEKTREVREACAALLEKLRYAPLLHPLIASAMHREASLTNNNVVGMYGMSAPPIYISQE